MQIHYKTNINIQILRHFPNLAFQQNLRLAEHFGSFSCLHERFHTDTQFWHFIGINLLDDFQFGQRWQCHHDIHLQLRVREQSVQIKSTSHLAVWKMKCLEDQINAFSNFLPSFQIGFWLYGKYGPIFVKSNGWIFV